MKKRVRQSFVTFSSLNLKKCVLIALIGVFFLPLVSMAAEKDMIKTASGLQYADLKVGQGETAQRGQKVTVHYTGTLVDGTKFDSSKDRNKPFSFMLGVGQVIKGWDEGVEGMKIGGTRKLVIPSQLGYGARGAGSVIPPNATLIFIVDLLDLGK